MRRIFGMLMLLGSSLAILQPTAALARDRDGDAYRDGYRNSQYARDSRRAERERHERMEARQREKRREDRERRERRERMENRYRYGYGQPGYNRR